MKMPPPNRHGGTPIRMKGEKIDPKVIKRVFSYLSVKHRLLMLGVVLCIIIASLANVASSLFLGSLIDGYIEPMLLSGSTDFTVAANWRKVISSSTVCWKICRRKALRPLRRNGWRMPLPSRWAKAGAA